MCWPTSIRVSDARTTPHVKRPPENERKRARSSRVRAGTRARRGNQPRRHRGAETPRLGGGAERRARPESDGNASRQDPPWLAFPSDPAAHAGLLRRPAAEPIGVHSLRALRSRRLIFSVSPCLCGLPFFVCYALSVSSAAITTLRTPSQARLITFSSSPSTRFAPIGSAGTAAAMSRRRTSIGSRAKEG